ncbi:GNAT family N-acetyltransferase [Halostagnicola bangensis]
MQILESPADSTWRSVAEQCDYATFFHTPIWGNIVSETFDEYSSAPIGAELDNGTRVILPLVKKSRVATKYGVSREITHLDSTFAGCYGDIIADGPLTPEWTDVYDAALSKGDTLTVVDNPFANDRSNIGTELGDVVEKTNDFTQVTDLRTDFETLFEEFQSDVRENSHKAREMGASVQPVTEKARYREYFAVYQDSLERWGEDATNEYPWELFETVYDYAQRHDENVKLWGTVVDGDLAYGQLTFYWNDHVVPWHAASNSDYFAYNPSDLLDVEVIRDAIERGYDWYDFNPSGGHEGVVSYKSKFATRRRDVTRWQHTAAKLRYAKKVFETIR